ncbi:hypothetical protein WSK_1779 [Novosphingobium sp. Rr 2-17]|uniref:helix-turn-helix transcriptional regulator n=1 Tax=Novosphingobium sp. Rr 2-17 TaxID=555793 RepID=UPI000269A802|nr:AlpA family phage regulatory protein [Novosphingobium sp. Rr 2-17]EIZ79624.1 hypothetical protein WSK_1779 [Novosphingobium sp. Rr 2-17]
MSDTPIGRFIGIEEVVAETSLSRSTIYRLIARGKFPRNVQVSEQRVAWPEKAVQAWKSQRFSGPPI